MATLRIYDLDQGALAVDLRHLLGLLAPRSLRADWTVSTVKFFELGHEWFEATGHGGEELEKLAQTGSRLSGLYLAALAKDTRQVIWGEFVGAFPEIEEGAWVTIRAIDSTFYEVATLDQTVLDKIMSSYKDVRRADA
jgi:hypothetical protein